MARRRPRVKHAYVTAVTRSVLDAPPLRFQRLAVNSSVAVEACFRSIFLS
jgi:hypothetical protein